MLLTHDSKSFQGWISFGRVSKEQIKIGMYIKRPCNVLGPLASKIYTYQRQPFQNNFSYYLFLKEGQLEKAITDKTPVDEKT
jgi:hypothetical protein